MALIKNGSINDNLLKDLEKNGIKYSIEGFDLKVKNQKTADFYGSKYGLTTIGSRGGFTFWGNIKK